MFKKSKLSSYEADEQKRLLNSHTMTKVDTDILDSLDTIVCAVSVLDMKTCGPVALVL
jgi:hypothetical protein